MLKYLKGLKFPDEMLVRFFFKEELFNLDGNVLELGCGNGCNLDLFSEYDFKVTGVDINNKAIMNAKYNFDLKGRKYYQFINDNIYEFLKKQTLSYKIILLPSVLYYMHKQKANEVLELLSKFLKPNTYFYFRMRTPDDYRYRKGNKISNDDEVLIDFEETGELGCTMSFWETSDFVSILYEKWKPSHTLTLNMKFDNIQNGKKIYNSDFIVFGKK